MKKILFAVDIDETLGSAFLDGKILSEYEKISGKKISPHDLKDYYFSDHPWLDELYYKYLEKNYNNFPLFENAKKVLTELKNQGIRLIILTSRESHFKAGTIDFLEREFGKNFFEKLIFTSDYSEDNKAKIAKNEGCDIVIDDALHHIDRYFEQTDCTILRFSAGWNEKNYHSPRVITVANWEEVQNFFKNWQITE